MHLAVSTFERVRVYQIGTIGQFLGSCWTHGVLGRDVEDYKKKRKKDGRKASTINDELKVLRHALTTGVALGYLTEKEIPSIRNLPVPGKEKCQYWTGKEAKRLLTACKEIHPDIFPLVSFLANTGCRKGEAINLRSSDVDLDNLLVTITPYKGYDTKTGKSRTVPINNDLASVLRDTMGSEFVFLCPSTRKKWGSFPDRKFKRVVKKAGLEGSPHKLRHTYASHLVKVEKDLHLVAGILGHSHSRTTELYAHLLPGHLDRARKAVSFIPSADSDSGSVVSFPAGV